MRPIESMYSETAHNQRQHLKLMIQFSLSTFTEDKNKIKKRITPTSMIPSLPKHNFHRKKKNQGQHGVAC